MSYWKGSNVNPLDPTRDAAVKDFFDTLTPNDKALFKATTFSEQILADIQEADAKHKDNASSRKISAALKRFVAGVEIYGKALDVFANSSEFLCPIWGGVRIVLSLGSEFGTYFDKLSSMFELIGRHLSALKRYPKLYPDNKILQESMVAIYQAIFKFCSKAKEVFNQGKSKSRLTLSFHSVGLQTALKLLWKPFKIQFGEVIENINSCMDAIEKEVEIAEKEMAGKERKAAEAERHVDSFRWTKLDQSQKTITDFIDKESIAKVNGWLAPANVASNHNAASKLRQAGTGLWFLEGEVFQHWLTTPNSFLWLHAIPGAGKTVLASSTINYLRDNVQSSNTGVAYFYCDYTDPQKQSPSKVLGTLLSMLGTQNRAVFLEMQSYFEAQLKENAAYIPEFDELLSNFNAFICDHFDHVVIVIDALDECANRECLAGALKTLASRCHSIKILVTSRNEVEFSRTFDGLPDSTIEQADVAGDIETYIKAELDRKISEKRLKLRDPKLKDEICQSLLRGAQGMFQWVKCQIEQLCKLRNDKAIRGALQDLPKTLYDTYTRILQRIEEETEEDIESVQRLLRWLVRGSRNLSLDELAESISIDPDDEDVTQMDFDAVITDPEDILELCGSLVVVSVDGSVALAHYSVKEFLVSASTKEKMPKFWVGSQEVESELATVCLKYLSFDDFEGPFEANTEEYQLRCDKYKLLPYAIQWWGVHAYRSQIQNHVDQRVLGSIFQLFDTWKTPRQNFEHWSRFYHKRFKRSLQGAVQYHPLHAAADFGLVDVVMQLLDSGQDLDCSDALKAAASGGHTSVVRLLLSRPEIKDSLDLGAAFYNAASKGHVGVVELFLQGDVDINVRAGKDGNALQAAALAGHPDVVSLLLEHGADHKFPFKRYGTPLAAAAEKGHQECFQILLDHGANPNGKGGWYAYPLVSAIVGKNTNIIQALLDHDADLNALGGRHGCPLMAAASFGMTELVQQLIDRGAQVNDWDDKGADALYAATVSGHLHLVNLLLDHGADVNAKGGKHRCALNAASAEGHLEIVLRLIEAGADLEYVFEHYGNAMQAAAQRGHADIVAALAKAGMAVDAEGGDKGSALVCAATYGHDNILELLFELGVEDGDNEEMTNALVLAAAEGRESAVKLLVQHGADINSLSTMTSRNLSTPLEAAANRRQLAVVKVLIDLGADVNQINDGFYGTALIAAIYTDYPNDDTIKALLEAEADVNATVEECVQPKYGCALAAAAATNYAVATSLLLECGADINLVHGSFMTSMQGAAKHEDMKILDILIEKGGDVNLTIEPDDPFGDGPVTPLQEAAWNGHELVVRKLVSLGANLSLEEDHTRFKSALQVACFRGHVDLVKILLELGSEPNEVGGEYGTALQAAASENHEEILTILLDFGADIGLAGVGEYSTALSAAAHEGCEEAIRLLVQRGADINQPLGKGYEYQYVIQAASKLCYVATVDLLIELGADVNATGGRYCTALQACASDGDLEIVDSLLSHGADPNIQGGQYGTALQAAYRNGYFLVISSLYRNGALHSLVGGEFGSAMGSGLNGACAGLMTELIRRHRFDLNLKYGKFGNALQNAIAKDRDDSNIIGLIISNGPDFNAVGGYWGTALNAAAYMGNMDAFKQLLEAGANPNLGNKTCPNVLHAAIRGKEKEIFDLILEDNLVDVNVGSSRFGSPLMLAAKYGQLKMVRALVRKGALINVSDCGVEGSPLQSAVLNGYAQIARYLINHGADVNARGGTYGGVLNSAIMGMTHDMIEYLLQKGCDPNEKGRLYGSPLQGAAAYGDTKSALVLLRYGANVNQKGGKYGTALQAACISENSNLVQLLIDRGADLDAVGGLHRTALHAAAIKGVENTVRILLKSGATWSPVDPQKAYRNSAEAANELLEEVRDTIDEDPDWEEVDDDDGETEDSEQEDYGTEEEGEEEEDTEDEEEGPRPWNVESIPFFDQPYVPPEPEDIPIPDDDSNTEWSEDGDNASAQKSTDLSSEGSIGEEQFDGSKTPERVDSKLSGSKTPKRVDSNASKAVDEAGNAEAWGALEWLEGEDIFED